MISKVPGAVFAAALMVAGLGSAQAQETLKIGGVGPLSGGGASTPVSTAPSNGRARTATVSIGS